MNRALFVALFCATAGVLPAQNRNVVCPGFRPYENVEYDGRYAFVRVEYGRGNGPGGFGRGRMAGGWWHDYPTAECHFNKLLANLTTIRARQDGSLILSLDDPELFKYPIVYMSEPGAWFPTESEVTSFRKYLQKGGFMIFDDFDGYDINNVARQMDRVFPGVRLYRLDEKQFIFDSFYRVKTLDFHHPMFPSMKSSFYAVYENNDPRGRMLAILNNDNDVGDYWEWSDTGLYGIDPANEAYKLGINYILYAMSR